MSGIDFSAFLPPYQAVELPSKGKYYQHIPSLQSGWVHIREYSSQEEALLSQMNRENMQQTLNTIFANCIKEDAPIEELTTEDAFYLLMWERANSYGPTYDIEIQCPHRDCGQEGSYPVNLSELKVTYLEDDAPQEPLQVILPKTKLEVDVVCMRRSAEQKAIKRQAALRQIRERGGAMKGDINELLKRGYSIMKVRTQDGKETTERLEIEKFCLQYLHAADAVAIDQALLKFRHGVDVNVQLTCHSCGREIYTVIPPSPEFFRPTRLSLEAEGESTSRDSSPEQVRESGQLVPQIIKSVGKVKTLEHA